MYTDLHDQAVSTKSDRAFKFYLKGLDKLLGLDDDGISDFQKSINLDPEFALVYALLANQCLYFDTRKNATKYLKLAIKHKKKSSQREQSIIRLIELMINGNGKSLNIALEHIDNFPRDVIVLSFVLGPFGLLAFSGNLTTSKALALCANLLTKPLSSKAEISLCIPDFDFRLSEFFISS